MKPSVVALSSGTLSIPTNRPICAYCVNSNSGKLVVLGSYRILSDTYIDKEKNDALREMIFDFFDSTISNTEILSDDGDVSTNRIIYSKVNKLFHKS